MATYHTEFHSGFTKEEITFINFFLQSRFDEAVSNAVPLVIDDTLSLKGIVFNDDIRDVKTSLIRSNAGRKKIEEAIRDLFRKNSGDCKISAIGIPSLKHVLISAAESNSFFGPEKPKEKDGWAMFYEKYPDSPGIIKLSRVGFSRDGSVAIVYMGNQSQWLAGSGGLVAFEKKDGQWRILHFNSGRRWVS